MSEITAGGPHQAARDEEISNWVKWRRSDPTVFKRPSLYYLGENNLPTALDTQDMITFSEDDPFTGEAG
jgi:hypothetical protein